MNCRPFPFLLTVLLLGACQTPTAELPPPEPVASLQVSHVRVQYAAAYSPGQTDLGQGEATRLETFIDQAGLRSGDKVYVALPNGDLMAAARIGRMAARLAQRNIGAETVAAPATGLAANHMLVMVDRYVVTPPACPNWSDSPETPHDNTPNSNYGCATLSNLAEMIDNPRDLEMGRPLGPADAEPGLHAIQRYRSDQVKPFLASGSTSSTPGSSSGSSSSGSSSGGSDSGGSSSSSSSGPSSGSTSMGGGATSGSSPSQ
jgi:pilus assembly protein CpaD